MSFGNRPQHTKMRRKPAPEAAPEEEPEQEEKKFHPEFFGYMTAMIATIATFGGLIAAAPHTYSASEARVSYDSYFYSAKVAEMSDEDRAEWDEKNGIDFSLIMTPPHKEESEAMRAVARRCMPGDPRTVVAYVNAPGMFRRAGGYLRCAMRTNRERLCNPAERARLVEQLQTYLDRRQDMLALNKVYESIDYQIESRPNFRIPNYVYTAVDRTGKRTVKKIDVGDPVDPKITTEIATLVHNGYLSASDFGFFGLYLPRPYTKALTETPVGQSICQ